MVYLMHLNQLRNIEKIRFGSIELIRTNSVEFDSVRYSRKVLEFHCMYINKSTYKVLKWVKLNKCLIINLKNIIKKFKFEKIFI
jgi:hypothetical protein